ncbi:hypothetical protein [Shinella pollutisoli]|uniref:Uncharacterized protein n=1 Tax=Shinella pollutisoli TaxID=2250594 RepID=A0ABV7DLF7_9HYPH|nr:hypothetical protein [Shinella pollutisoli]
MERDWPLDAAGRPLAQRGKRLEAGAGGGKLGAAGLEILRAFLRQGLGGLFRLGRRFVPGLLRGARQGERPGVRQGARAGQRDEGGKEDDGRLGVDGVGLRLVSGRNARRARLVAAERPCAGARFTLTIPAMNTTILMAGWWWARGRRP